MTNELYLGGQNRTTCVGLEPSSIIMRATGDIIKITNYGLVVTGRTDSQVKVFGNRVALSDISFLLLTLPEITQCVYEFLDNK